MADMYLGNESGGFDLVGTTNADLISYDNTNSGLGSTNVQGAIDELNSNLEVLKSNLKMKKGLS